MTTFTDTVVFNDAAQAHMPPCNPPVLEDFLQAPNTLIWANINGEMRLYSYDGVNIQYQTLTLSAKVNQ